MKKTTAFILTAILFLSILTFPVSAAGKKISCNYISQVNSYPTGCESVTTVMALRHVGIDISVNSFIDNYLAKAPNPYYQNGVLVGYHPDKYFIGSPYNSYSFGCYSSVIYNALIKFVDQTEYSVEKHNGVSLQYLCENYIDKDCPVILWATMSMRNAWVNVSWRDLETGNNFNWIAPEHCLLLVGYDDNYYYFNDPLVSDGWQKAYSRSSVEKAYNALGQQSVVVKRKEKPKVYPVIVDLNGDEIFDDQDAIYLLFNFYFPDKYPVERNCDFDNSDSITDQDAIYLLYYYYFPDKYPVSE